MRYRSVCSGIEAASVAWHPLGWEPVSFAEISAFPSAVLKHHYPQVPNVGDFSRDESTEPGDLLVGGTPCQAFSIAGLRGGLSDVRGNLALEFCRLADRFRPRWVLWENVPGVLSSGGGRDFGSILGALVNIGYGCAYRVLDAQFFGVPQRRRRVFLVGYLGDWRRAAAVLFERESLRRDTPKKRKARSETAPSAPVSVGGEVSHTLKAEVIAFAENQRGEVCTSDRFQALSTGGGKPVQGYPAIAFHASQDPVSFAVTCHAAKGGDPTTDNYVAEAMRVRRLTPRECERLQGFPDDYTLIPGASDTARYHALGNSMAVPVMRWIGERIQAADEL